MSVCYEGAMEKDQEDIVQSAEVKNPASILGHVNA
jgi:hypothetical protein